MTSKLMIVHEDKNLVETPHTWYLRYTGDLLEEVANDIIRCFEMNMHTGDKWQIAKYWN
jgi:hypothetical protein